jgi:diguanylate cyclase (GGDEF)-like protein
MLQHVPSPRFRIKRYAVVLWPVLALLCCAAMWTTVLLRAKAEAERANTTLLKEADAYAAAYEQYVTRSLAQMDQITMQIKHSWEQTHRPDLLEDMRGNGMFTDDAFTVVGIVGPDGRVRSSAHNPMPERDFSQAAFFVHHKSNISTALRIGIAPPELQSVKNLVLFTRRLDGANDEFDGVVLMAVGSGYFTSFLGPVALGKNGILAVAITGGRLLGEQRGGAQAEAQPPLIDAGGGAWQAQDRSTLIEGHGGFADGVARVARARQSSAYPVTTAVALSQPEALASAELYARESQGIAFAVTLGVVLLAGWASLFSWRSMVREREHEAVRRAYRTATENANDGFYMATPIRDRKGQIVDFRIVDCNERGAYFYGLQRSELLDRKISTIARGEGPGELLDIYRLAMSKGFHEEDRRMPEDPRLNLAWGRRRVVRVGDGLAITVQDIGERKAHEEQMTRLANQDSLTGLPNRHWLLNFIPSLLARARVDGSGLALLFLDLDEFKQVNDSHGHAVGDRLLLAAAQRLASLLRPTDRVARFGGDEFVVVLEPVADECQIAAVAERIVTAFRAPFPIGDGIQAAVGATVGISLFPQDGGDAGTLIGNADIAMYAAKGEGKCQYRFFDHSLSGRIRKRAQLKQRLLEAIEHDQFQLHYQPRVDALSGELLSMEALLRWRHPEDGLISPGDFIPVAESSGLIVDIGALVIDKACAQLADWREQGARLVPVSINVSPRQFARGGIVRQLETASRKYAVPGALLEVEITESAMMGEQEAILVELADIRALGIKLHVDDFGTGYSSLSQLQRLRMDVLKVDRAFTAELDSSREGRVFFQAIVSMAHALGMTVVAEGVETARQLEILRELRCDEVQGYFISKPVSAQDMGRLLSQAGLGLA